MAIITSVHVSRPNYWVYKRNLCEINFRLFVSRQLYQIHPTPLRNLQRQVRLTSMREGLNALRSE